MRDCERPSQLPVVDQNGRAMGILDESDVLVKVARDRCTLMTRSKSAMTRQTRTLSPTAKIKDLLDVFDRGRVANRDGGRQILGLVTRSRLLSYLRYTCQNSSRPKDRH